MHYLGLVDSELVTLYWHVGRRNLHDVLKARRAEYGEKIVSALGTQLSVRHVEAASTSPDR